MDRARRAGLRAHQAAVVPARAGRQRSSRASPATTRSSCRPTARAGCTRRAGCSTGRCRAHYEPHESPVLNPLYGQQANPTRQVYRRKENLSNPSAGEPGVEVFPYVFTTYRLTEHHTAGGMSRWVPYLSELQPEMFCEVSPELAAERGPGAPRLGDHHHRAHRHRGARARHRPDDARCTSAGTSSTRSGCPTTGASATRPTSVRRLRERPGRAGARPQRAHPGEQGGQL